MNPHDRAARLARYFAAATGSSAVIALVIRRSSSARSAAVSAPQTSRSVASTVASICARHAAHQALGGHPVDRAGQGRARQRDLALELADRDRPERPQHRQDVALLGGPDFVSWITVHPGAADATDYEHIMLVPAARADDAAHWDKSWTLIEASVFQREDLWVCEQVQRGLAAGATHELLFGELEESVRWFHAAIDRALAGA